MRRVYVYLFIVALALCFLPRPAAAQSSCSYAYCESYIYYDSFSNEVFGYARSSDYIGFYMVAAEAQLYGPSGPVDYDSTDWWWFEATAYVSDIPTQYGPYFIDGYHYYGTWDDYVYWYDGATHAEASAPEPPNPPYISEITVGGDPVRGGSGMASISGWDLLKCSGGTTVSIEGGISASVTSADCNSQSQLNFSYTIPMSAATGRHTLRLTTPFGSADGDFYVYDPSPSIDHISSPWQAGGVYEFSIAGTAFGSNPSISIDCAGVGNYVITSHSDTSIVAWADLTYATCGTADVEVTSHGWGGNNLMPAPGSGSTGEASGQAQVVPAQVPVSMKFQHEGTVISTDGRYSEDTTIRVTAVRSDSGVALTSFVGTVQLAEDGTSIYQQNGGAMPQSVDISSSGTATFVVKSLAGPKTHGQEGPDPARIKSVNYPVYGGSSLVIPQWIISGQRIDPRSSGPVFDWFQTRSKAIFDSATGDLGLVLGAVSSYTIAAISSAGETNWQRAPQSPIILNPYYEQSRLDSPTPTSCGFPDRNHFRRVLLHEARHAYQASQAALSGNDLDGDFLVRSISIAPTTIFLDTATPRSVCKVSDDQVLTLSYKGDTGFDQPDTPDFASYAWEYDARAFAVDH